MSRDHAQAEVLTVLNWPTAEGAEVVWNSQLGKSLHCTKMNRKHASAIDHDEIYELSSDTHSDNDRNSTDEKDSSARLLTKTDAPPPQRPWQVLRSIWALLSPTWSRRTASRRMRRVRKLKSRIRNGWRHRLALLVCSLILLVSIVVLITGIFFPSYTRLPAHYRALQERIRAGNRTGRGNTHNEKIFIAASIYDPGGMLAGGDWGRNVLDLVEILGPEHVFLSIYENDSGDEAMAALADFETQVPCEHTIIAEPHLDVTALRQIMLPNGEHKVKRIEYLAEVRNRALKPLETARLRFDKVLYLNDVMFHAEEAAQLLFSTNSGIDGRADYRAACAIDFINVFKFYDTFASRDMNGYSLGVPFFPWLSMPGESMDDLLAGKDAVRVRSCWGGMVAFDAKYFQKWQGEALGPTAASESPANLTEPYRFRAEEDLWWDASECCLIHADIQSPDPGQRGIYMNPFVRVAYDSTTLSWLAFTRRFERLYRPIHRLADFIARLPHHNTRRAESAWQEVREAVWVVDESLPGNGTFRELTRTAQHAGFCGRRALQVMKEEKGTGKNWEFVPVPVELSD